MEGFTHRTWRGSRTVRGGVHAPCVEGFTHRVWGVHAPCVGGSRTVHGGDHAPCVGGAHTMRGGSENFKCPPLFVLGYHWLPIATIDLVGNNREIEV